ncbi:MAG: hypothetical protein ACOVQG_11040 [Crocinitomicaceae bacterium]
MKPFFYLFLLLLTSCTAQKVSVFMEVYKPYCGGAKPTPEIAKGIRTPFSNEKVAFFKMSNDLKSFDFEKWIQLDSLGNWNGKLKQGTYIVFRSDKMLTIEEIEKKFRKPDSELYAFVGIKQLETWKATADFTFEVKDETNVSITLSEKCFVGLNPCMEYIGPKPR